MYGRRLAAILRWTGDGRGLLREKFSSGNAYHLRRRCSSSVDECLDSRLGFVSRELEGLSLKPSSGAGDGCGEGRGFEEVEGKEVELSHRWPEWVELMETLQKTGYLKRAELQGCSVSLSKHANRIRTACLDYARERSELIRYLSREDIQVIVRSGCPSSDRKVTNSGKRLRAYVGIDEGKVCSSCRLRGSCERAYLKAREDERGRTVDVMRILLTLGLDLAAGSSETEMFLTKSLDESARRMLSGMVELGVKGMSPPDSRTEVNPLMKQGDWICPKCNFLNFAKNVKCLRCNGVSEEKMKKFKEEFENLPLKKGDWICRTCNFLNFAKNTRCLQCQEKPTGRQLGPGEWECSSCSYVNFRKNEFCLKCGWKRPKAALLAASGGDSSAEEWGGAAGGHCRLPRISFVETLPPAPTVVPERDEEIWRSPRNASSSMGFIPSELDKSTEENEMAGWFGPARKEPV